ncbi:conserved hypothetical protein [Curtobacterium sp. 8I-2]|nr:conserved hypothetical protein [Curtobacterium sp. 8I-2]
MLEPKGILDPELFVPAGQMRNSIEYWSRLMPWVSDRFFLVGPRSYERLSELCGTPPGVTGIPAPEIWRIIGELGARPFVGSGDGGRASDGLSDYSPFWGELGNGGLLEADMRPIGDDQVVVVGSDERAWNVPDPGWGTTLVAFDPAAPRSSAWLEAWRSGGASEEHLARMSEHLFPNLVFHGGAWSHLGRMKLDVQDRPEAIAKALAVLDVHAARIWRELDQPRDRQSALGSRGADAAPENGNTRGDSSAMKRRQFTFDGQVLRCEWHIRLQPHTDRIYFRVEGDKVYVGDMTDHL